jgi:hypothetical protein
MEERMTILAAVSSVFLLIAAAAGQTAADRGVPTLPLLPSPENDPFVGTWHTNSTKSNPKPHDKESTYIRTMVRDGDYLVISSHMENHGRKVNENHNRWYCDGAPHPVSFGFLSCVYKSPSVIEGKSKFKSGDKAYWHDEVSADGREMRTLIYEDRTYTRITSSLVMDRVN